MANSEFEYVCQECVTIVTPDEMGQHVADHDTDGVVLTRREFYERHYGPVEDDQ